MHVASTRPPASPSAMLTKEQWDALVGLMSKSSANQRLSSKILAPMWIIDSSATHHMTGDLKLLNSVKSIAPRPVTLSDGKQTMETKCVV